MLRRTSVATAVAAAILVACGSDRIGPVSRYMPAECKSKSQCDEGGLKLDGGTGGKPADAGPMPPPSDGGAAFDGGVVVPHDGGALHDAGAADSGVLEDAGVLIPDAGPPPPPPSVFLDLRGTYHTRYSFDLSQYLFGISGIAGQLDTINQILMGHINTGVPLLDGLIAQIIMQYVPSWVATLVSALDTIANLFSDVRVNGGLLTITQDPPLMPTALTTAIHATETWQELVIMIIGQCPLGRMDPSYPTCAEHHIPVTHNPQNVGPVTVLVTLPPFDGTLNAGIYESDFVFHPREVQLEMRKLILLIVNVVVSLVTPYPDLQTALGAVIDCNGLGQQAVMIAENNLGLTPLVAIGIGALVTNQCNDAINSIVGGVGNIGVMWEAMSFDQHGHAKANAPSLHPYELENWNVPNTIDGHFRFAIQSHMGGNWEGLP